MKTSRLYGKKIPYAFTLLFLFLLVTSLLNAQPVSQTFNSNGTYTVPIGYTANVTIRAWGGGAGGGSGAGESGGGGGGAYASVTTILPAGSYAVSVGAGGTVGNAGGNSSFTSLIIAAGGSSTSTVTGGAGGTALASTGTTKFAGGAGGSAATTGGAKGGGGGGGSATSSANGGSGGDGTANPTNLGGAGGTGNGTGGRGADGNGTPDAAIGGAVGAGGGGRGSVGVSKSGANGQVVVSVNTVLPVKLGNIKAYEKQGGIQIDWTAYSEENVSSYQIERSANGATFNSVGEVTARNAVTETKYGFFDNNPLQTINFYRLKNIDLDGKSAYSNIVKINLDKNVKDISIYPNPVIGNNFSLQVSDLAKGNYSVKVFAAIGQQVYRQEFSHNGGAINQSLLLPNGIKPGVYSIVIENDYTKVMSKKLIVQ